MRHNDTLKNTAADGHVSSEGALLVDVNAGDSLLRGLEAQTNILVVSIRLEKKNKVSRTRN